MSSHGGGETRALAMLLQQALPPPLQLLCDDIARGSGCHCSQSLGHSNCHAGMQRCCVPCWLQPLECLPEKGAYVGCVRGGKGGGMSY